MAISETAKTNYQTKKDAKNVGESERVASGLGGGALAAYGLYRMDLIGAVLAALGGALLYRGATGHSPDLRRARHQHGERFGSEIAWRGSRPRTQQSRRKTH